MTNWRECYTTAKSYSAIQLPGENQCMYIWFMTFMKDHMCSHSKSLTLKPQNLALCNGHGETQQFEGWSSGFALLGGRKLTAFRVDKNSSWKKSYRHADVLLQKRMYINIYLSWRPAAVAILENIYVWWYLMCITKQHVRFLVSEGFCHCQVWEWQKTPCQAGHKSWWGLWRVVKSGSQMAKMIKNPFLMNDNMDIFPSFLENRIFLCVCFSSLLRNHWNNIHLSSLHSSASLAFAEHAAFYSRFGSRLRRAAPDIMEVADTWLHCPGPAVCSSEIKQLRPSSKRCWIKIVNKT